MPTDAQRRNLASAHHAEVAQHEETILWQAAEISKHLDKIALLEQQLAEARASAYEEAAVIAENTPTATTLSGDFFSERIARAIRAAITRTQKDPL